LEAEPGDQLTLLAVVESVFLMVVAGSQPFLGPAAAQAPRRSATNRKLAMSSCHACSWQLLWEDMWLEIKIATSSAVKFTLPTVATNGKVYVETQTEPDVYL
jgi:hypothetical protein